VVEEQRHKMRITKILLIFNIITILSMILFPILARQLKQTKINRAPIVLERVIPQQPFISHVKSSPIDSVPLVIHIVDPIYPDIVKSGAIQGFVTLDVEVLPNGTAGSIEIVGRGLMSGPGGPDEAAIEAVRQWKFEPARRHGQPVVSWVRLPFTFVNNFTGSYTHVCCPDGNFVRLGTNITPHFRIAAGDDPVLLHKVEPVHPNIFEGGGQKDTIRIGIEVFEDGCIGNIEIMRGLTFDLDCIKEAIITAVRQWKFSPYHFEGRNSAVWTVESLTIEYKK
jgi:TonB family protein